MIPPGSLVMGSPGKMKRPVTERTWHRLASMRSATPGTKKSIAAEAAERRAERLVDRIPQGLKPGFLTDFLSEQSSDPLRRPIGDDSPWRKRRKFQAIKGTRDFATGDGVVESRWSRWRARFRQHMDLARFARRYLSRRNCLRESMEGDDIVSKEMYSFEDRDETSVSLASRGDGVRLPGVYRAWDACVAATGEAVLHGADVSAGAAAKGKVQTVLPDWRGGAGGVAVGAGRRQKIF